MSLAKRQILSALLSAHASSPLLVPATRYADKLALMGDKTTVLSQTNSLHFSNAILAGGAMIRYAPFRFAALVTVLTGVGLMFITRGILEKMLLEAKKEYDCWNFSIINFSIMGISLLYVLLPLMNKKFVIVLFIFSIVDNLLLLYALLRLKYTYVKIVSILLVLACPALQITYFVIPGNLMLNFITAGFVGWGILQHLLVLLEITFFAERLRKRIHRAAEIEAFILKMVLLWDFLNLMSNGSEKMLYVFCEIMQQFVKKALIEELVLPMQTFRIKESLENECLIFYRWINVTINIFLTGIQRILMSSDISLVSLVRSFLQIQRLNMALTEKIVARSEQFAISIYRTISTLKEEPYQKALTYPRPSPIEVD